MLIMFHKFTYAHSELMMMLLVWSSRSPSESSPAVSPHLSSSPRSRAARSSSSQLLDVGWTSDRHASGSRSLGTSPRPSTSLDPADPVLALPRAGQRDSNQELDQALEMSQLNLRGKHCHTLPNCCRYY